MDAALSALADLSLQPDDTAPAAKQPAEETAASPAAAEEGAEPVLRGGADAAFDAWGDDAEAPAAASEPIKHRCMTDAAWDSLEAVTLGTMCDALNDDDISMLPEASLSLTTELKPHRVEPLANGFGSENLVCSLRQFTFRAALRGPGGELIDDPSFRLAVALVFADGELEPVEAARGEPPLSGEIDAAPVGGVATFRLRISALSYHHHRRHFALLVTPADPARQLQFPNLSAISEPLRSVARLPNETKPERNTAGVSSPTASFDTGGSSPAHTIAGSPVHSPSHTPDMAQLCDPRVTAAALEEVAVLRAQLQASVAQCSAYQRTIEEQAQQLRQLQEQHEQILAQVNAIRAAGAGFMQQPTQPLAPWAAAPAMTPVASGMGW